MFLKEYPQCMELLATMINNDTPLNEGNLPTPHQRESHLNILRGGELKWVERGGDEIDS